MFLATKKGTSSGIQKGGHHCPKYIAFLDHSSLLPPEAFLETVALAVHLDDVAVVSQAVKEGPGKGFIADFLPAGKLQVGGDDK